jgi:predicted sulfurtransferase
VFDKRVAVTHGLAQGDHVQCDRCGMPVATAAFEAHTATCRTE